MEKYEKIALVGIAGLGAYFVLFRKAPRVIVSTASAPAVGGGPLGAWFNAANQGINGVNQSVAGAKGVVTNVQSSVPGIISLGASAAGAVSSIADLFGGGESTDTGAYDGGFDSSSLDSSSFDSIDSSGLDASGFDSSGFDDFSGGVYS